MFIPYINNQDYPVGLCSLLSSISPLKDTSARGPDIVLFFNIIIIILIITCNSDMQPDVEPKLC